MCLIENVLLSPELAKSSPYNTLLSKSYITLQSQAIAVSESSQVSVLRYYKHHESKVTTRKHLP